MPTRRPSWTSCAGVSARPGVPGSSPAWCSTRGRGPTCSPGWRPNPSGSVAETSAGAMAEEPFAAGPGSALQARRALVLAVVGVVALSRLAEGQVVWLAGGLVTLAVLLGALQ